MGKNRTQREKCAVEECTRLGALQGHCHHHYVTRVYRKKPEVRSKLYEVNRSNTSRFNRAKHWAIRHGFDWAFTKEEYSELIGQTCHYCGANTSRETGKGLDRLDNLKGYIHGNVVPCCGRCNRVRGYQFTPDELRIMMKALAAVNPVKD